ncbi:MAG: heavy-metal-associated domain-containing protein [Planctomycetota bacterium]|jgi:copper chaperone
MTKRYKVDGMTCGGCAGSVTRAIMAVEPNAKVEVDVQKGIVSVEGVDDDETVGQAVADAGFTFGGRAPETA